MIKEFKDFIMKGNVLDLAVAVIIAGAFGAIVTTFTSDVLMPPIGMLLGGVEFDQLAYILQEGTANADGVVEGEVAIRWGKLVKAIIDFLIIAFVLFLIIKGYNKANPPAPEPEAPAGPSDNDLLTEIRDLLKK